MFANLTGWHFLAILVVILLIFGATRLPALARSVGQSTRILKEELKDGAKPGDTASGTTTSQAAPPETPKSETPAPTGTDSRTP